LRLGEQHEVKHKLPSRLSYFLSHSEWQLIQLWMCGMQMPSWTPVPFLMGYICLKQTERNSDVKDTAATWDKTTQQLRANKRGRYQAVSLPFMLCTTGIRIWPQVITSVPLFRMNESVILL